MSREIIPDNQTIIALDTNVFRNLCYDEPSWVDCFDAMSVKNYHFCLTDIAYLEIINQLENSQISAEDLIKAVRQTQQFISDVLPILPGRANLIKMCGIRDKDQTDPFDSKDEIEFSKSCWLELEKINTTADLSNLPVIPGEAEKLIVKERKAWIGFIKNIIPYSSNSSDRINAISDELDKQYASSPKFSERIEIVIHFLDHYFSMLKNPQPLNPQSKKRKNDGIDFLLTFAVGLPAILCTEDHIRKLLNTFNSYQKDWVMTPEEIEKSWNEGVFTDPQWL